MSVIIRLQNLPWSANALDIREFFKGLSIPEGGVHIVGGERGDAFIAFSSDEDARLAMQKTGSSLKGIQISLLLSSRTEMQKVIETARQQALGLQSYVTPQPAVVPPMQPLVQPQQPPPNQPQIEDHHQHQQQQQQQQPQQQQQQQQQHHQHHPLQPNSSSSSSSGMFPDRGSIGVSSPHGPPNPPPFAQPINSFNSQPPTGFLPNQMSYSGQKMPAFPPGVMPPGGLPSQFYGHAPSVGPPVNPMNSNLMNPEGPPQPVAPPVGPMGVASPHHFGPLGHQPPNTMAPSPLQHTINQQHHQQQQQQQQPPQQLPQVQPPPMQPNLDPVPPQPQQGGVDKRDRKLNPPISTSTTTSSSTSSTREKRDGRDSKGRDDRRRRSTSRSRSKDRDHRRRRYRSRSRSRSRDKSSRRVNSSRRSRSRDRDRGRDRDRDRDRDREGRRRDSRSHRGERSSDRTSATSTLGNVTAASHQEILDPKISKMGSESGGGGIPGLGEIPDDIPKEGLSIFTPVSNAPVQTRDSPSSTPWPKKNEEIVIDDDDTTPLGQDHSMKKPFQHPNAPQDNAGSSGGPPLLGNEPHPGMRPNQNFHSLGYSKNEEYNNNNNSNNSRDNFRGAPKDRGPSPGFSGGDRRDWSGSGSFQDERSGFRNSSRFSSERSGGGGGGGGEYDSAKRFPENNNWGGPQNDVDKGMPPRDDWGRGYPPREDDRGYFRMKGHDQWTPSPNDGRRDQQPYPPPRGGFTGNFQNDFMHDSSEDHHFGRGGYRGGRGSSRRGGYPYHEGGEMEHHQRNSSSDDSGYRDRFSADYDGGRSGRGGVRGGLSRGGRGGRGPVGTEYSRERRGKTCCVELIHVPSSASYRSIREYFNGISVPNGGIKILGDRQGNRIGVALVQFTSTRDAYEAFKRSGSYLHDSRILINFIDEAIYLDSKDICEANENPGNGNERCEEEPTPCLYVSGLPIGCTDHDVGRVFEKYEVQEIVLELEKGSRQPSGGCFLRFSSPEEAKKVLMTMEEPNIDGTPIKVDMRSSADMESARKEREKIKNYTKPPQSSSHRRQENPKMNPSEIGTKEHLKALSQKNDNSTGEDKQEEENETNDRNNQNGDNEPSPGISRDLLTDSVVVKNVSADIRESSIRDFFSDEGLIPEKIFFNRANNEGKADVFVVFPMISDAKRALEKNLQKIGSTTVTVELISKPTVMLAMGLPFDPRELFQKGQRNQSGDQESSRPRHDPFAQNALPRGGVDGSSFRGRSGFNTRFQRNQDPGYRPRQPMNYRNEQTQQQTQQSPMDLMHIDTRGALLETPRISADPPENFGKPGCVVALANVPYQATTEDILNFFKDFDNLQPENIIRRYDERNRPTSDSRVALQTPEDAVKAVDMLNRKFMLGRPIYMSLVN